MKFNTYDELLNYLRDKELPSLTFEITTDVTQSSCPTGDCDLGPKPTVPPAISEPMVPNIVEVAFVTFHNKPIMEFEKANESLLVVESFEHIPNACSTTLINIAGREILTGVCEGEDGCAYTRFDVMIDGKLHSGKKFRIVTDPVKYKNTINVND